jgi:hypothetical protein
MLAVLSLYRRIASYSGQARNETEIVVCPQKDGYGISHRKKSSSHMTTYTITIKRRREIGFPFLFHAR